MAAERELRASCETLEAIGDRGYLSTAAADLAEALYAQGRYDEAELRIEISKRATATEDVQAQIGWRTVRAKVLARRGRLPEAEALAREALELAKVTDGIGMHAAVLRDLAEVLALAGREREAAAARVEALRLYEKKGAVAAVERVRASLATARLPVRASRR